NDIDFLHSTITINKSWDDTKKAFKTTKTESSKRTIKVNRQLLNRLAELKANNTTMVFQNVLGTIPTSNALNKCLRSIMSDIGINKQGFHFHSLRHVHVAYLLGKGVDVYAISKRLGHSNITITLNTYSYLIDEYKAKNDTLIIDKLSEL
ncbi:tyrosine-type recombinase/integrase, partial [Limosilactobacillus reuteri]